MTPGEFARGLLAWVRGGEPLDPRLPVGVAISCSACEFRLVGRYASAAHAIAWSAIVLDDHRIGDDGSPEWYRRPQCHEMPKIESNDPTLPERIIAEYRTAIE